MSRLPTVVRGGGEVVPQSEAISHFASAATLEESQLLARARDQAIRALLTETDQVTIGSGSRRKTVPVKSGWGKLARHFRIDLELLALETRWEELPHDHEPHFVARAVVEARTPWGQTVQASRICSTREDKFGQYDHEAGRQVPNWKARQSAENDCTGIAQTRAEHACLDRLLALGALENVSEPTVEEREAEETARRAERRERARLEALREWSGILEIEGVSPEAEAAFCRLLNAVPDDPDEWTLEHARKAIDNYKRRGVEMFDRALEHYEQENGGPAPGPEQEKQSGAEPSEPPEGSEEDGEDPGPEGGEDEPDRRGRLELISAAQSAAAGADDPNLLTNIAQVRFPKHYDEERGFAWASLSRDEALDLLERVEESVGAGDEG